MWALYYDAGTLCKICNALHVKMWMCFVSSCFIAVCYMIGVACLWLGIRNVWKWNCLFDSLFSWLFEHDENFISYKMLHYKNAVKYVICTIISWPDPKYWLRIHYLNYLLSVLSYLGVVSWLVFHKLVMSVIAMWCALIFHFQERYRITLLCWYW